jgi:hypothetical protein
MPPVLQVWDRPAVATLPSLKGCWMAHMYVDPYAILDVTYLVAAFLFNGHGKDDGEYLIGCVLDLGETVERVALVYPTQQTRDAAFIAIGRMVSAYEAEQAALEDDDL